MTYEEKELLLKDLSARLPYRPKFRNPHFIDVVNTLVAIEPDYSEEITSGEVVINGKYTLNEVRLYLRPMSSMTEDEEKEFLSLKCGLDIPDLSDVGNIVFNTDKIDWLNSHHFDYRGLIPKSLAIEAPEDMYNTNTN